MRYRITTLIIVVSLIGFAVTWIGCNSNGPTDIGPGALVQATSMSSDRSGVVCKFGEYTVDVSELTMDVNNCSVRLHVSGAAALAGDYTLELRGRAESEFVRVGEAVIRDELGDRFGLNFRIDRTDAERVEISQRTDLHNLRVSYEVSDSGWVTESFSLDGNEHVLVYPQMTPDELLESVQIYEDLKSAGGVDDIANLAVNERQSILIGELTGAESWRDAYAGLDDRGFGELVFNLIQDETFLDLLRVRRTELGIGSETEFGKMWEDVGDICDTLEMVAFVACQILPGSGVCAALVVAAVACRIIEYFW